MNCWEYKYIQEFQRAGKLITEQQTYDFNPSLWSHQREKKQQREPVRPVQYSNNQAREGTQQHQHKAQQVRKYKQVTWTPYKNNII